MKTELGKSDQEIAKKAASSLITGFPNKAHRRAYSQNVEIILSALREAGQPKEQQKWRYEKTPFTVDGKIPIFKIFKSNYEIASVAMESNADSLCREHNASLTHRFCIDTCETGLLTRDVQRPNWLKIYGYKPSMTRPQELVSITRHTAYLATSALAERMEKDYYHNDAAACRELDEALTSSASQTATGARENEKPVGPWIRTAERAPSVNDSDSEGKVVTISHNRFRLARHWRHVYDNPELFPLWVPIPKLPDEISDKS